MLEMLSRLRLVEENYNPQKTPNLAFFPDYIDSIVL